MIEEEIQQCIDNQKNKVFLWTYCGTRSKLNWNYFATRKDSNAQRPSPVLLETTIGLI